MPYVCKSAILQANCILSALLYLHQYLYSVPRYEVYYMQTTAAVINNYFVNFKIDKNKFILSVNVTYICICDQCAV